MILITGATGLLGSHLLYYLLKENTNNHIRTTYRSEAKKAEVSKLFQYLNKIEGNNVSLEKVEWVQCDLNSVYELDKVIEKCTHVYHCAAKVSFYKSDYQDCLKYNVQMTRNVVNSCINHQIKKLAYVSSTSAVGSKEKGLTTEKDLWKLTKVTSGYSISKYKAELEVWRGISEGLNAVILNPCVILGAGNWNTSSLKIFKTLSKGLKFYTPGTNAIVDARDASKSLMFLMSSELTAQRFLAIGANISYLELFQKCSNAMNVKSPKYCAPFLLAKTLAYFTDFFQFFKKNKSGISIEMVNSTYKSVQYDASKLMHVLPFKFHSLEQTIQYSIHGRIH